MIDGNTVWQILAHSPIPHFGAKFIPLTSWLWACPSGALANRTGADMMHADALNMLWFGLTFASLLIQMRRICWVATSYHSYTSTANTSRIVILVEREQNSNTLRMMNRPESKSKTRAEPRPSKFRGRVTLASPWTYERNNLMLIGLSHSVSSCFCNTPSSWH